jgi:hypothetical protein
MTTGMIGVEQVEEHEDGSATYQFHLDNKCAKLLQEEGLKLVLYCAAAKLDLQIVYDFIEDHIKYETDEQEMSGTDDTNLCILWWPSEI